MKNSKLVKMLFTIIMGIIMCVVMVGQVKADNYQDLSSAINGTSTSNSSNSTNRTNSTNNTSGSSSLNSINNTLRTNSSNTANTANTSTYNNTSLPNTGIGDSVPVVLLVVVFGISAIYAYKKIKEYKNI